MNMNKMYLIAQCIVNRTIGKDVRLFIEPMSEVSYVSFSKNYYTNKNKPDHFSFGAFQEHQKSKEWYQIVTDRFPITKTVEPCLFAMLHEVGHIYAPSNLTDQAKRDAVTSSREYRDLPDEAFADKWAATYITKNKLIVQLWNTHIKEAL